MNSNSVIAEVRKVRAEIAARYGNDLDRYSQHLAEVEAELRKSGRVHFVDYSSPHTQSNAIHEEPSRYDFKANTHGNESEQSND